MRGLILKDIYNLLSQMKIFILFPILALVLSYFNQDITMMLVFSCIFPIMCVLSAFAYDEQSKFNSFGLTLPVRKRDIVLAKYMLKFVTIIGSTLLFSIVSYGIVLLLGSTYFHNLDISEFFEQMVCYAILINIIISITLPLNFKFGTQKGRIILVMIALLLPLSLVLLRELAIDVTPLITFMNAHFLQTIAVLAIGIEGISFYCSVQVCNHKEY